MDPRWGSSLNPAREKSSQYTLNNASIVHGLVKQGLLVPSGVRAGIHQAVVKASEATMQNHGAGIGGRRWHNHANMIHVLGLHRHLHALSTFVCTLVSSCLSQACFCEGSTKGRI